jgi:2'-5' RNA ligase
VRKVGFRIRPTGFGAFPSNKKAHVLWSGVDEGSTALSNLAADVEEVLEALGFGREKRRYKPHVTLGRVRGRPARLSGDADVQAPVFTARRLDLVESLLGAGGATYEKLESYPLSGET